MTTRGLSKYFACARVAARQAFAHRAELYGRVLFFGVVLAVFSALWRAVAETGMPVSTRPESVVWYLAITEWIALGAPLLFMGIEEEVKRGDVAYRLARPISYVGGVLAEGLGQLAVRMPFLGLAGFTFAWLFTGTLPERPETLLLAIPFVLVAASLLTTFYALLGLLAFWLGEVSPCYWVFQKLLFVFGGLMLPLDVYPRALVEVARWTPFPSVLYGPGSIVLGHGDVTNVAIGLIFWLLVALALMAALFARARRSLELNGG